PQKLRIRLCGLARIICRPGFILCWGAEKGELLHASDSVSIGAMQIGARNFVLVQLNQDVLLKRLSNQKLVLAVRAVAPENVFRFGQGGDLLYPIEHGCVARLCIADPSRREGGGREIFHRGKMPTLTTNAGFAMLNRRTIDPLKRRYFLYRFPASMLLTLPRITVRLSFDLRKHTARH